MSTLLFPEVSLYNRLTDFPLNSEQSRWVSEEGEELVVL